MLQVMFNKEAVRNPLAFTPSTMVKPDF